MNKILQKSMTIRLQHKTVSMVKSQCVGLN